MKLTILEGSGFRCHGIVSSALAGVSLGLSTIYMAGCGPVVIGLQCAEYIRQRIDENRSVPRNPTPEQCQAFKDRLNQILMEIGTPGSACHDECQSDLVCCTMAGTCEYPTLASEGDSSYEYVYSEVEGVEAASSLLDGGGESLVFSGGPKPAQPLGSDPLSNKKPSGNIPGPDDGSGNGAAGDPDANIWKSMCKIIRDWSAKCAKDLVIIPIPPQCNGI